MEAEIRRRVLQKARVINATCLEKVRGLEMDIFNCSRVCDRDVLSCFSGCTDPTNDRHLPSMTSYCSYFSVYTAIERMKLNVMDVAMVTDVDLGVVLFGYITPVLFLVVLFLNTLMVAILSNRQIRSPTNMILCSIAILDTLTIGLPLPWYLYFYSWGGYSEFVPLPWCLVYQYMSLMLPTMCHNSSLWLTVALAAHRYIGVCHPRISRFTATYKAVSICLAAILVVTSTLHSIILAFEEIQPVRVVGKDLFTTSGVMYIDTCSKQIRMDRDSYQKSSKIYMWTRIVAVELLPLTLLLIFNTLLLRKTCNSYRYRRRLVTGNKMMSKSDFREVMRTTIMLVTLCLFSVLVELPVAIALVYLQSTNGVDATSHGAKVCMTVINFILFLSFPANFAICLGLSEKFRRTLGHITCFGRKQTQSTSGMSTSMISMRNSTRDAQSSTPMLPISSQYISPEASWVPMLPMTSHCSPPEVSNHT